MITIHTNGTFMRSESGRILGRLSYQSNRETKVYRNSETGPDEYTYMGIIQSHINDRNLPEKLDKYINR